MIRIYCVNCKTLLEIDDGFAGGVCRCIHCGKMQSVPKASRATVRAAVPEAGSRGLKSSERQAESSTRILSPSSITGSGLGSDNIGSAGLTGRIAAPAVKSNSRMILVGVATVIVLLSGLILWVEFGGNGDKAVQSNEDTTAANGVVNDPQRNPRVVKPVEPPLDVIPGFAPPSFAGVSLTEPSVVYMIDRSGLPDDAVAIVKRAVLKSIDSLHTDQQFQIIVWKSDSGESEAPIGTGGLSRATPDAMAAATADLMADSTSTKIAESDQPPKSAAISQPDSSAAYFEPKQDFSDNPGSPGQTFTPTSNLTLQAITVKGFGNSPKSFGLVSLNRVTITISRVGEGGVLTQLAQESAVGGFTKGGAYQTFILSRQIPLSAGTQYAYSIFTEAGFYGFAKSTSDVYPGGAAMQQGKGMRTVADGAKIENLQGVDRTFFINPAGIDGSGKSVIETALAQSPAVVLIVSGKNYDEPLAARLLEARNNLNVKFDVVRIGDNKSPPGVMRKLAERAGGQYREVNLDSLQPKRN